uniref:Uncharacterized protein n=1 Tax=Calidris pygmaea TaxID=425635 RepID=A0A8C3J3B5_9CHAR
LDLLELQSLCRFAQAMSCEMESCRAADGGPAARVFVDFEDMLQRLFGLEGTLTIIEFQPSALGRDTSH